MKGCLHPIYKIVDGVWWCEIKGLQKAQIYNALQYVQKEEDRDIEKTCGPNYIQVDLAVPFSSLFELLSKEFMHDYQFTLP